METILEVQSQQLPRAVPLGGMEPDAFTAYYRANQAQIEADLRRYGAIKFDGVRIGSSEAFQRIVNAISNRFVGYIDGTSPRTQLTDHVYTSTEYDKSQRITMHNELSYSARWPARLYFCCLQPAATGGETLLADSRKILRCMDPAVVAEVEKRGITYIRNLHAGDGPGMSWQQAFQTDDKKQLEKYCALYGIAYEWRDNNSVRLKQQSTGIITHPQTGEKVWFNQIDQFHPYQLGEELYAALMTLYDSPEDLPTYVKFGDGTRIDDQMVQTILTTIDQLIVAPPWAGNQFLMIDNVLVSHGRSAYTGNRKVLVAMTD
jgi:alpha-ketoglutarate-dependent taurine dioxygenase